MDLADLGQLLRRARESAGRSRAHLAAELGVSVRLLAELERGARPNVSLETAVRLLTTVGVTLTVAAPGQPTLTLEDARAAADSRARVRRTQWSGRITTLYAPPDDFDDGPAADRLARVGPLSSAVSAVRSPG